MRILLVGAGGVGSAFARIAARRPFAELVVADYDLGRAQRAAGPGGTAVQLDARDEKHLLYVLGLEAAVEQPRNGTAQIAFLLKPTSIQQVADTSFAGGVMPQKSTDFYPKLLSGLAIYKLE